jgi:HTH-type transcriptional regulator / antitoxin HigA
MKFVYTGSTAPPGYFIREELDARGLSQADLAWILGRPPQGVSLILSGKRGISPEMAKALGAAFDLPATYFANLQTNFALTQAREPDPTIIERAKLIEQRSVPALPVNARACSE